MRDDQHRAREAGQELLQPVEAVEVEVVGRLVEQQDGRPREQHAGQQRARRLSAGERAERRVERHVGDAERGARAVELRVQRPAAERAEALLRLAVRARAPRDRRAGPRAARARRAAATPRRAPRRAGGRSSAPAPAAPGAGSRRGRPARARPSPRSGASTPASSRSSVVLPAPLGPTRPMRRSPDSVRLSPSKIVLSPYSACRSDAVSMRSSVSRESWTEGAHFIAAKPSAAAAGRTVRQAVLRLAALPWLACRRERAASGAAGLGRRARGDGRAPARGRRRGPADARGAGRAGRGGRRRAHARRPRRADRRPARQPGLARGAGARRAAQGAPLDRGDHGRRDAQGPLAAVAAHERDRGHGRDRHRPARGASWRTAPRSSPSR